MAKVYIFLADGFEEVEAITVVDLLRRADIDVTLISINDNVEILGAHGIVISADKVFEEVGFSDVDMLILPGGVTGTKNLAKHSDLIEQLKDFNENNKMIAAICAAPTVLGANDILKGRKATCYPGLENELIGAYIVDENVVCDENIITSKGLGTAIEFSLTIISHFQGSEMAQKIRKAIIY